MKSRLVLVAIILGLWGGGIAARLHRVQVVEHQKWTDKAGSQQVLEEELSPPRGTIYDRAGRLLAVSTVVESAYVPRPRFDDPEAVAQSVAGALGRDVGDLGRRLAGSRWTWLARQLEPPEADRLRALAIEGLQFREESKRFYPLGDLAGPVLGFVGVDHVGLAGLEAAYDAVVTGQPVFRPLLRDARLRRGVGPSVSFLDAQPGDDLHLTIDAAVQHIVERELRTAVEQHSATGAAAVLMDPGSGAVYAMASLPSFDPNRFGEVPAKRWRNRAIQDVYEPGSTFKLITAAAALEANLIDPMDVIDCEMGSITLGRTRIRDHERFAELTFNEVFARSSNVGAIKVGLMVGANEFSSQIESFGFGTPTGIDLPGEASGIVRPVMEWARHEVAYAAIGQGLAVTPLQLARAFGAVANGGIFPRPHVVRAVGAREQLLDVQTTRATRLSPATARTLLRMLEGAVENGTGRLAAVDGYRVAGKTGTAQISVQGGYAPDRYVASFAGFAPSRSPRIVGVVTVFEPRGRYHGGEVAAPVFARILEQALPLLGAVPERPESVRVAGAGGEEADSGASPPVPDVPGARRLARAGAVPDFTGLTARQALALAAELGLEIEMDGSGFVVAQEPLAGELLAAVAKPLELKLTGGQAG